MSEEERIEEIKTALSVTKIAQKYTNAQTIPLNYICDMEFLLDLCEKQKEKNEVLQKEIDKKIKALDIAMSNPDYICKDKITKILGIEEKKDSDFILRYLETIVDEWNRLEDIEDRKIQIEYENVFNKGVKSVEEKIKEKIEIYRIAISDSKDGDFIHDARQKIQVLKELLEE